MQWIPWTAGSGGRAGAPGRAARAWQAGFRRVPGGLGSRGLERVEHGLGVAGDLDPAPLPVDAAVRVDQEGAALDAHVAAAVEDLLADHAEGDAECLVAVAGELERELVPGAEVGEALHRVARDAQHRSEEHTSELRSRE